MARAAGLSTGGQWADHFTQGPRFSCALRVSRTSTFDARLALHSLHKLYDLVDFGPAAKSQPDA